MNFYKDVNTYTPTEKPDVLDVNAIVQSVRNLILTRPGERPFEPEYGINAEDLLFELMDDGAGLQLYNEIVDKVERYEPRVLLDTSLSEVLPDPDNNSFEIKLYFEIQGFEGGLFEMVESVTG